MPKPTHTYAPLPTSTQSPPSPLPSSFFPIPTSPRSLLLSLLLLFFFLLALLTYLLPSSPIPPSTALPLLPWGDLWELSKNGWKSFEPSLSRSEVVEPKREWGIDDTCVEEWVGEGVLCRELMRRKGGKLEVDVIVTWVNGSDLLVRSWREGLAVKVAPVRGRVVSDKTLRHFRSHNELLYSLRALLASFSPSSLRKIHLVTLDLPSHSLPPQHPFHEADTSPLARIVQIPTWLDLGRQKEKGEGSMLELKWHSEIFPVTAGGEGDDGRPSFNSLAIESRLSFIPDLAENVLYTNDDVFLLSNFTATDIFTPLTGPTFRIQRDLTVAGLPWGEEDEWKGGDPEGEWPGLGRAGGLLDERFGKRERGYLSHVGKVLNVVSWKEAQKLWEEELLGTTTSRFRGTNAREVQTIFLSTHYHIERHRELLLYSYFYAKLDTNHDGYLSLAEQSQLLIDLGSGGEEDGDAEGMRVSLPRRSCLRDLRSTIERVGWEPPGSTHFVWTSGDGFGMSHLPGGSGEGKWPSDVVGEKKKIGCRIPIKKCLGFGWGVMNDKISVAKVFKRVSYELGAECGDCMIAGLVAASGPVGFSAFLPTKRDGKTALKIEDFVEMPREAVWRGFNLTSNFPSPLPLHKNLVKSKVLLRRWLVKEIHRYSYTLGNTRSRLVSMRNEASVEGSLHRISNDMLGMVTLNDDIQGPRASAAVDEVLGDWFETMWGVRAGWEKLE